MNGFIEVISEHDGTVIRELIYVHIEQGQLVIDRKIVSKVKAKRATKV